MCIGRKRSKLAAASLKFLIGSIWMARLITRESTKHQSRIALDPAASTVRTRLMLLAKLPRPRRN
jgi:hypothetical protein